MKDLRLLIKKLPLDSNNKLKLYNYSRHLFWISKYGFDYKKKIGNNVTFIPTNLYYGHEYWLKKYSGFGDYIYGMIEHGLYFGDDKRKIGFEEEWDLGSIITYGDYRMQLLKQLYPDINILAIGPRIHYAQIDETYFNELKQKIDLASKTIALYPAHSIFKETAEFNYDNFIKDAIDYADSLQIKNILISLHPTDLLKGRRIDIPGHNVIVVSGGNSINFLPRIKAIMTLADIIYTNSLGTHVGYSVYLNKPNVLNLNNISHCSEDTDVFYKEQEMFGKIFNGENPFELTKEQWELCDYYFGFSHVKAKIELYDKLQEVKNIYKWKYGITKRR